MVALSRAQWLRRLRDVAPGTGDAFLASVARMLASDAGVDYLLATHDTVLEGAVELRADGRAAAANELGLVAGVLVAEAQCRRQACH